MKINATLDIPIDKLRKITKLPNRKYTCVGCKEVFDSYEELDFHKRCFCIDYWDGFVPKSRSYRVVSPISLKEAKE